jgi:predicted nucleotidyltransferase
MERHGDGAEFDKQIDAMMGMVARNRPGRVLFAKVAGSRGYNVSLPESDYDFAGVWAGDLSDLLGLNPSRSSFCHAEGEVPNYSFYEARNFVKLLLAGNPAALDMAFTDRLYVADPVWKTLQDIRHRFVTRHAVNTYVHYLKSQWKRYDTGEPVHTTGGQPNPKWMYHILRLPLASDEMSQGRPPMVWASGTNRDMLMDMRTGLLSPWHFKTMALQFLSEIDSRQPFPLPDEPDREAAERWLLSAYGVKR